MRRGNVLERVINNYIIDSAKRTNCHFRYTFESTLMVNLADRERLAAAALAFADRLYAAQAEMGLLRTVGYNEMVCQTWHQLRKPRQIIFA